MITYCHLICPLPTQTVQSAIQQKSSRSHQYYQTLLMVQMRLIAEKHSMQIVRVTETCMLCTW